MYIEKLASQIRNDVVSGLRGYHSNLSMNMDQLQDEVVACRLAILKQNFSRGQFPIKDLLMSINCIQVDCKSLERCHCDNCIDQDERLISHFEIPQVVFDFGKSAIEYIGSTDRQNRFSIITSLSELNNRKYRKRGQKKPYVWIDVSPNYNGMLDCYLFNAPFVREVSIVAIFKDPRQLTKYSCCNIDELNGPDVNMSFIDQQIKEKLVKEKIYYYRSLQAPLKPNDQEYTT